MIGEAFAALSAVCYGFSGAAIAKGAKARPATAGTDNGVFLSVLVTTVFSAVLWAVLGTHETWPAQRAPIAMAIAAFVVAGLLATVLGRLANFRAIAAVGAIRASLFRRLIPVFSAFLAFFLLGERYSPMALGGMALVLCSVALTLTRNLATVSMPWLSFFMASAVWSSIIGCVLTIISAVYFSRKLRLRSLGVT